MSARESQEIMPHVFLTRFNIPANRLEERIYNEQWLQERIELFERYTLPSVRAQDPRSRHWLVYLGDQSPSWLVQRMTALAEDGLLKPIYLSGPLAPGELQEHIRDVTGIRAGLVTSANLDNDDAIAANFLERARSIDWVRERSALTFANGLVRNDHSLREFRYPENPFVIVADRLEVENFTTCWSDWHNRLHRHVFMTVVEGGPAWLQVVHQRNVSNRVRGRLTNPSEHSPNFPGMFEEITPPSAGERIRDAVFENPRRKVRDGVRGWAAETGRQILGQQRVDEVKDRLMRWRRA